MKKSIISQLLKIDILSYGYHLKKKPRSKIIKPEPTELDFEYLTQINKKNKTRKRLMFHLKTNEKSEFLDFQIEVCVEFKYVKENATEEEENKYIIFGLIPQTISFIRGFLYSSTSNTPCLVQIPFIDVIQSLQEKEKNETKKKKLKNSKSKKIKNETL